MFTADGLRPIVPTTSHHAALLAVLAAVNRAAPPARLSSACARPSRPPTPRPLTRTHGSLTLSLFISLSLSPSCSKLACDVVGKGQREEQGVGGEPALPPTRSPTPILLLCHLPPADRCVGRRDRRAPSASEKERLRIHEMDDIYLAYERMMRDGRYVCIGSAREQEGDKLGTRERERRKEMIARAYTISRQRRKGDGIQKKDVRCTNLQSRRETNVPASVCACVYFKRHKRSHNVYSCAQRQATEGFICKGVVNGRRGTVRARGEGAKGEGRAGGEISRGQKNGGEPARIHTPASLSLRPFHDHACRSHTFSSGSLLLTVLYDQSLIVFIPLALSH